MGTDNKLKKVKDEGVILSLLGSVKSLDQDTYIWKFLGSSKLMGKVRIESLRKLRKDFCIIPADGQDRMVQDLMSSQNHIDLYVPEAALLLRCLIKQTEAPVRYYLQLPEFIAQVDRRASLRLNVFESNEVKVSFGRTLEIAKPITQHFHKSCFDISAGGFSFYASKSEQKFFELRDQIQGLEVKTSNWSAKLSAEVSSIREIEPDEANGLTYKVWRVSCKFVDLDQISKKYLEKFIFERLKEELHAINE